MKGIVAAGHELTARAGVEMLSSGGNAFDAAVGASFASFVCESALTSPAGGGFFMAHPGGAGDAVRLYDFFTDVPGRGRRRGKEDLNFFSVSINFAGALQSLHIGEGSAAVPGTVAGLNTVYKNHCTLPLKTLLAPAIRYARHGIELNACQASFNDILSPMLNVSDESRAVYGSGSGFLRSGDTIVNTAMADTFEHLAIEGLERFYDGFVASSIIKGFGEKGLITAEDLKAYRVKERSPLTLGYRGRRIFTNPPPSSGGCLIAFALKLLEAFDLGAFPHNRKDSLKLLAAVMRVTNEARRKDFDHRIYEEGFAEEFLSPAMVGTYLKVLEEAVEAPGVLKGAGAPGAGNTTQISVIDKDGNAASVTTSTGIGCGFMIPGTGMMMNNMLGEEDLNPDGFHAQRPGIRMSSMMAPTMVMKRGVPEIVLGSGGSKRIRNAILQVILNIIDHGQPVSEAVNSPRVHVDDGVLHVEPGIEAGELGWARGLGMELNMWGSKHMYFGGVHTVVFEEPLGEGGGAVGSGITGAGDSRRGGVAIQGG